MKYMITEYQKTSKKVLISEIGMGNYVLSAQYEESDAEEVLMLHMMSMDIETGSSHVEVLIESVEEEEEPEDSQISLLSSF